MSRLVAFVGAVAVVAAGLASFARAEDDEAVRVRGALVEAARVGPAAVGKVLEQADALVGPGATFPGRGDLADWLGAMPPAKRDPMQTSAPSTRRPIIATPSVKS